MGAIDQQVMQAMPLRGNRDRRVTSAEHRFYRGFAVALTLAVLAGFARSYYLKPLFPDFPVPPEPVFALHGAVFTAWLALFVTQASLVAAGKVRLHRTLGLAGAALALLMLGLGVYVGLVAAARPGGFIGIPMPPLAFLVVPLFSIVQFALFTGLGLARLRDAQAHKRLMLLGTLQMATPGIARWPGLAPFGPPAFFGITDVFLLVLAVFDWRTRGRLHAVTLWGGVLTLVMQPLQLLVAGTAPWLDFAAWATGWLG